MTAEETDSLLMQAKDGSTEAKTKLLEGNYGFKTITVMVQKEVAQRIAAKPGTADYSAFTVFCQFYAQPELLFDVPPHCFMPQPKVTSAVVSLKVRKELPWDIQDKALFFRVVKASFAMRRKTLQNGLGGSDPQVTVSGTAKFHRVYLLKNAEKRKFLTLYHIKVLWVCPLLTQGFFRCFFCILCYNEV